MFTIIFNSKQRCDNVCFTSAKVLVFSTIYGVYSLVMGYKLFFNCIFIIEFTPFE